MSTRSSGVRWLYRLVADRLVGGRVTADGIDEMADVFDALWRERRGRATARVALAARELGGLWRMRARLRRHDRRGRDGNDWGWRDGMGLSGVSRLAPGGRRAAIRSRPESEPRPQP